MHFNKPGPLSSIHNANFERPQRSQGFETAPCAIAVIIVIIIVIVIVIVIAAEEVTAAIAAGGASDGFDGIGSG
jgi:hypothetical protein